MKYFGATFLCISIGICFGSGFCTKIDKLDSHYSLWTALALGSIIISLVINYIENVFFPKLKFKFIFTLIFIGSSLIVSFFFTLARPDLTLLILFISIPIAIFFILMLTLLKIYYEDKQLTVAPDLKEYNNKVIEKKIKNKGGPTMLQGVQEIKKYVDKREEE